MSSSRRRTIEDSWDFLATLDLSAGNQARDIPELQTPHGSVLLSQDSEGTRHVLVPIAADEVVTPDTNSRGVQLVKTSFSDKGKRRHFVDIRCPEPRLHRVFNQIAASMLDGLTADEGPVAATCARILASWRALLRRASKPLSPSALRGVFGELWFLAQLAQHSAAAVDYWTGPDDAPQDFISAHGAFEIKTTARNPARRVPISSIDQLDDSLHPFSSLVVLSLVEDPKGTSVEGLIDVVVDAGAQRERLLDQLAKAGVQEADLADVAKLRWRVAACTAYRVSEGFPRVTPASFSPSLPPGIHNLRYEIELAAAGPCVLSDTELSALQRQFLAGDAP
ncbi:hypothetical protein ENSA5_44870 [Enhygromyxa salina]|uniref:PD-(D/E)XK motif protein n=1 Tax=Enhygromyxa salina TaxID=215803 RepID=A0A2S9XJU2_9BACT|nr:PD-(D/E)XK motif protein [Enhygromyxa salina]PRP93148.1 hypothetical protein ENSA5_44870 [Enhygromyxa salina]